MYYHGIGKTSMFGLSASSCSPPRISGASSFLFLSSSLAFIHQRKSSNETSGSMKHWKHDTSPTCITRVCRSSFVSSRVRLFLSLFGFFLVFLFARTSCDRILAGNMIVFKQFNPWRVLADWTITAWQRTKETSNESKATVPNQCSTWFPNSIIYHVVSNNEISKSQTCNYTRTCPWEEPTGTT